MPPKALPEGWLPASTCFASLTAEQLKEKGLPTDEKELIELLRYIYSDGHGFMYCTGDFSDPSPVDRPGEAYDNWADALKQGKAKHRRWNRNKVKTFKANRPSSTHDTTGQKRSSSSQSSLAVPAHNTITGILPTIGNSPALRDADAVSASSGITGATNSSKRCRTGNGTYPDAPKHALPAWRSMPLNHVSQHSLTASDRQQTLPPTISPGCPVAATELLQEPGGQQAFMLPTHVHGSAAPTGHVVIVPVQLPVSAQFGGVPPAGLFLQAPPVPSIHLFKLDTSSDMAVTAPAQLPQMYLAAPSPHGLTLHTPQPPAAYALPNQDSEHYTTMGATVNTKKSRTCAYSSPSSRHPAYQSMPPIPASQQPHAALGGQQIRNVSTHWFGGHVPADPMTRAPGHEHVRGQNGGCSPSRVLLPSPSLPPPRPQPQPPPPPPLPGPSHRIRRPSPTSNVAATAPVRVSELLAALPSLKGSTQHVPEPPGAYASPDSVYARPAQAGYGSAAAPVSTLYGAVSGVPGQYGSGSKSQHAQLTQLQSDVHRHSNAGFSRVPKQQVQQSRPQGTALAVAPVTAAETAVPCPAAPPLTSARQHTMGAVGLPPLPPTNMPMVHPIRASATGDAVQPLSTAKQANSVKKGAQAAAGPQPAQAQLGGGADLGAVAARVRQSMSDQDSQLQWDSSIDLLNSTGRALSGQRLMLSTVKELGEGGCGTVYEVKVKLFGDDSLATVQRPCAALKDLLRKSKCACTAQQGPSQDPGIDLDSSFNSTGSCHCSVRMALKAASLYESQPQYVKNDICKEDYDYEVCREILREYNLMQECHKAAHVINGFAVGMIKRDGEQQPCLLMELSELGSAESNYSISCRASKGLSDVQAQHIVKQVAAGLCSMHQNAHTIHRDVKWSNLLLFGSLDAPLVKICDFGISRQLADVGNYGHTMRCTPEWAAPEQSDSSVGQDWRLDSFPLGLLVLALRTGRRPFWWLWGRGVTKQQRAAGRTAATLDHSHCPYNHDGSNYTALGPIEKAFVKRCIVADSNRRPSPVDLIFEDPYLGGDYVGG